METPDRRLVLVIPILLAFSLLQTFIFFHAMLPSSNYDLMHDTSHIYYAEPHLRQAPSMEDIDTGSNETQLGIKKVDIHTRSIHGTNESTKKNGVEFGATLSENVLFS
jgi:hypothetical protein